MTKELSIEVVHRQGSRILGGSSLKDLAPLLSGEPEVYLVYDRNVAWVAEEIAESVRGSLKACIGIETSEELKCMDAVLSVTRQLLEAGASRKALLVAIGGGITTDLAGFAASIYKRGIRYANVPTTLLSQVDAAIGGKNGVNLDGYKNMLGTITQPEFTFLCARPLKTLPPREFRCGVAEMLKTFLLADADAYAAAVRLLSTKNAQNVDGQSGELQELLLRAAEIKAGVVQRDPFEQGERAKLNLGHTFGHAIEHEARLRGEDINHGEAVAIGIILAAEMSDREGLSNGLAARLKADFNAVGLPTECPYPLDMLKAAMAKDKKAAGGKVKFILLRRPGEVIMKEVSL
jgi:3-dehydroquinate synthase